MARPLARLRSVVDARMQAWIRRRQGPDADPVLLDRRRLYILPTPLGVAYAAMLFAMVLGGMNYGNNLGLALAFLLASLGLVAMHHCHGTLAGLALRLAGTESGFAGQVVSFRLLLENSARLPRPQIEVGVGREPGCVVDVPASGTAVAELRVPAVQRGRIQLARFVVATRHPMGLFRVWAVIHGEYQAIAWPAPAAGGRIPLARFVVATRHPMGLFRAWAVIHGEYQAIAWPAPAEGSRTPPGVETDTGGAQDRAQGDHDFAGLRPYQSGDPLRRIAWKAYARGQGLHTKQYAGTDVVSHVFDWDSLPTLGTEARLSQLCRWVLEAHQRGEAFGLRLPGAVIEPNLGTAHRERCLNALALFDGGHGRA